MNEKRYRQKNVPVTGILCDAMRTDKIMPYDG